MLFGWLKHRSARKSAAAGLYQAALRQSRDPAFYAGFGVADTMDGRFDLLSLHIWMLIDRLEQLGPAGHKLGQAVFDAMFKRMDLDLREMGIGDLGVPKHMQKMMKAFNGRVHAYHTALESGNMPALELALARNVFRTQGEAIPAGVEELAAYTVDARRNLQGATLQDFQRGNIVFARVAPVVPTEPRMSVHG